MNSEAALNSDDIAGIQSIYGTSNGQVCMSMVSMSMVSMSIIPLQPLHTVLICGNCTNNYHLLI